MLIIPVLMTVNELFVNSKNQEFQSLLENVIDMLEDNTLSVTKTAKRLI